MEKKEFFGMTASRDDWADLAEDWQRHGKKVPEEIAAWLLATEGVKKVKRSTKKAKLFVAKSGCQPVGSAPAVKIEQGDETSSGPMRPEQYVANMRALREARGIRRGTKAST